MRVPFPPAQLALNLLALLILGIVAILMVFNAVPPGNRELMSAIIGGVIGFLTGAVTATHLASGQGPALLRSALPPPALPPVYDAPEPPPAKDA